MKKLTSRALPLIIAAALAAPFFEAGSAHAIPAFVRQNKTECATCHTIFPELTEQGENFYKNSFVWETAATKVSRAAKEKEAAEKPYLYLSSLPEFVPVSLTGTLSMSYLDQAPREKKWDMSARALVLEAGGALADKLGFYANYTLYSEGPFDPNSGNVPANNNPNLNELFVSARHVFDTPVNVKAGRMRPDLSIWKGFNKTSISPVATTSYRVGASQYFVDAPIDALEANAVLGGRVYAAIGGGKRKQQDHMEGFGSISYKIGGADFEGRERPILDEESIFDFLIVTLNGYAYVGSNQQTPSTSSVLTANDFYRYGFETDLRYQRWHAKLATVFGKDVNPFFFDPLFTQPTEVKSQVFAADLEYLIGSNLIPSLRYEFQDDGMGITRRYIPALAYAPLQNAKLVLEYRHEDAPSVTNHIVNLAGVMSF